MKLIAQVKITTSPEHSIALLSTLERANAACNWLSEFALASKRFRKFDLCAGAYKKCREVSGLTSQLVTRCIHKVAHAYALDRATLRRFKPRSAVPFDDRILRWAKDLKSVNIWTVNGRMCIPIEYGERQGEMLKRRKGESDLVYRDGSFYLLAVCDVADAVLIKPTDALGVDLGVVNIATDSDGKVYSGEMVRGLRRRHTRLRRKLQKKQTRSATRLMKQRRHQERRFATDINHCISKQIVATAQRTNRAIALEELKGIRSRIRVRRSQRAVLHSWAFSQLRVFIEYKAQVAGIPVIPVDPAYTSRLCPKCSHCDKRNRPSQSKFSCVRCGFSGLADIIAATNIRSRAAAELPYATAV